MGIDPTAWPLDINVDYTKQMADRNPIEPGGKFTIYGDFCWGGEKERAEVYFISAGTQPPPTIAGTDIEAAKRTQQQLIASGLRGRAVQSSDRDIVFEAPDKDKILSGSRDSMVARFVVYDNKAHRASGVTASTILTLRAHEKSLPLLLIVGGAFAAVVFLLLLILVLRSGRRRPAATPAPVVAGGMPYTPAPSPYGGYGGAGPYGASPAPAPAAPAPAFGAPGPFASPAAAPVGPAGPHADFMYGGQPGAQYGLTMAQPSPQAAPPSPYAQSPMGAAARAVLSGNAGTYTVTAGSEMIVGRDAAKCHIALTEPRVSGVHATLKVEGGLLYVRDEQSNNGTFVDGHRLAPNVWTVAPAGGQLRFGPAEFNVRLE
jgi:hypothetical protein